MSVSKVSRPTDQGSFLQYVSFVLGFLQINLSIMRPEEIHLIIQQARNAWETGNADAFASLFTSDGEFCVPGNRWVGQEVIRQIAADFSLRSSDVKVEIRRIMVEGNQAVVEWYWEDTETATGRRNRADDAIVIDFEAGRIRRWREYIDTQTPHVS
ncbi:MAG TPA: SgcJ/EcaC family oxidoreductase [Coleofasciculaceae cyanobacterium]